MEGATVPNPRLQEWSELPRAKRRSRTVTFCPARTDRFWPQLAAVSNLLKEDGKTAKNINKSRKRSAQQDRLPKKKRTKKKNQDSLSLLSHSCLRACNVHARSLPPPPIRAPFNLWNSSLFPNPTEHRGNVPGFEANVK